MPPKRPSGEATPIPDPSTMNFQTKIDYDFYLMDSYLQGLRATVFAPNAMRCSQKLKNSALAFNATFEGFEHPKKGMEP